MVASRQAARRRERHPYPSERPASGNCLKSRFAEPSQNRGRRPVLPSVMLIPRAYPQTATAKGGDFKLYSFRYKLQYPHLVQRTRSKFGAPMSGLSRRLKQLDEELLALGEETMMLEELDGFIAGLLVCPDLIKPGEWLPIIWDRDCTDQQPAFQDLDHANRGCRSRHGALQRCRAYPHGAPRPLQSTVLRRHPQWRHPLGALDRGLREGRQVTTGRLAETPQRRCRYGGRHARNDGARRRRLPRSTPATKGS